MFSANGMRRRRQRTPTSTFLPSPHVHSKPIQIIPPIQIQTNLYYEEEDSPFRNTIASPHEALLVLVEAIQECNCLGRAFCIFVFSIKMNIIENTHTLVTFLRYYPTIVGWLLLASKLLESFQDQKSKIGYKKHTAGSTHTFATVSSHMSYVNAFDLDKSEHSLDLRQIHTTSQSWGQFADIDISSSTLGGIGNKSECTHLHNMFSSSQTPTFKADLMDADDEDAATHQVETIVSDHDHMSQNEQSNQNEGSGDWGFFADFADAEPRPEPLNGVESKSSFQQKGIDFYVTCMRAFYHKRK